MKKLFVITGVCQIGEQLDLDLVKFLHNDSDRFLLWIDFKDVIDYAAAAAEVSRSCPAAVLRCAPRAIWGGPSIVESMLDALAFALQKMPDWSHAVFCSLQDVPLAAKPEIAATLQELSVYDYCGSRWNKWPGDVLRPPEASMVNDLPGGERQYDTYQIRPDMTVNVERELGGIFTADLVRQRRLCSQVFQRYLVGVTESFVFSSLSIHRLSRGRLEERHRFFHDFGMTAGRQWLVCSKRFAEAVHTVRMDSLFRDWFRDILIADECFFQTVAAHLAAKGEITVMWRPIFYSDATVYGIDERMLSDICGKREKLDLFARKKVGRYEFAPILAKAGSGTSG